MKPQPLGSVKKFCEVSMLKLGFPFVNFLCFLSLLAAHFN